MQQNYMKTLGLQTHCHCSQQTKNSARWLQNTVPCFFSTGFNFGKFAPNKEVLGESLGPAGAGEGDLLNPDPAAGGLGDPGGLGGPGGLGDPGGFGPKLGGGGTTAGALFR